jgi:hypothetical protein
MSAKQVFHFLSHNSSPFCSDYFGDRVSHFAQASLDRGPPILGFLKLLEMTGVYHHIQQFSVKIGSYKLYWSGLAWNPHLPRCAPPW